MSSESANSPYMDRQVLESIQNYIEYVGQQDVDSGFMNVVDSNVLDISSQTINASGIEPQDNIFVTLLGQSNAQHMSIVYDPYQPGSTTNDTSGATVLDRDLTSLTGSNVVTSDTPGNNFAVGGSKVNGNGYYQDYDYVWWYPDENRPAGALLEAEQGVRQWLADSGAQPSDEVAVIWSQGESDVGDISPYNPSSREQYKQSTLAVFDYLKGSLGYENITFYVVPTGRFQGEAAANIGLTPEEIDSVNQGTEVVRQVQAEIAIERDDVQLAPDYSDLNMVYEEGEVYGESYDQSYDKWSRDIWHLGHDGLKVNGERLAQYIALDRGQNNVISFTDDYGNPAESISIARDGLVDINIASDTGVGVIQGTDNPDVIVGTLIGNEIVGGSGNDVIIGSQGVDTLTGGEGSDVFFYDSLVYPDVAAHGDRIMDFAVGRDRLDISELLLQAGYSGSDPVADGYVSLRPLNASTLEVLFDVDGVGEQPANAIALLENVDSTEFQNDINNQFIFTPTEF